MFARFPNFLTGYSQARFDTFLRSWKLELEFVNGFLAAFDGGKVCGLLPSKSLR
jgi:hypothetical protein